MYTLPEYAQNARKTQRTTNNNAPFKGATMKNISAYNLCMIRRYDEKTPADNCQLKVTNVLLKLYYGRLCYVLRNCYAFVNNL